MCVCVGEEIVQASTPNLPLYINIHKNDAQHIYQFGRAGVIFTVPSAWFDVTPTARHSPNVYLGGHWSVVPSCTSEEHLTVTSPTDQSMCSFVTIIHDTWAWDNWLSPEISRHVKRCTRVCVTVVRPQHLKTSWWFIPTFLHAMIDSTLKSIRASLGVRLSGFLSSIPNTSEIPS